MPLTAAYIVPHPPLAIPEVGRGDERAISDTLDGYREVARRIAAHEPDDIIVISPHTAYYGDWVYIAGGQHAEGTMARFRAPSVSIELDYDVELRERIEGLAREAGIPAGTFGEGARELDHGMIVPLYFVDEAYPSSRYKAVSVGGSALPRNQLLKFGGCLADAASQSGRKVVLLVSGDLSHKLLDDGPYGFHEAGPAFDGAFVEVVEGGDPLAFSRLDPAMCEDAAECGLSGFIMMAGALSRAQELEGCDFTSELISHEGPFGVGYGVAAYERMDDTGAADASSKRGATNGDVNGAVNDAAGSVQMQAAIDGIDPLVRLATDTIDMYVRERKVPDPPSSLPGAPERAGCFVSIHVASTGELRGCIGTIGPVQDTLGEEIVANAVSASTRDPRFPAIRAEELDNLEVNVDVLFPPEPATLDDMDPSRYGIIVTQGYKRGLLLPDLDGVDTVEQQFQIACAKGGIDPFDGMPVEVERFEVVRHV